MTKKPASSGNARSAKTGKFVTKDYAKKNPSTTVVERKAASAKPAAKAAAKPARKTPTASGKPGGSDPGKKKY